VGTGAISDFLANVATMPLVATGPTTFLLLWWLLAALHPLFQSCQAIQDARSKATVGCDHQARFSYWKPYVELLEMESISQKSDVETLVPDLHMLNY
jgi:hypothetical protein